MHRVLVMAPYCSAFFLSVNIRRSVILYRYVIKSQTRSLLKASWAAHKLPLACLFFPLVSTKRCWESWRPVAFPLISVRHMEMGWLMVSISTGWPLPHSFWTPLCILAAFREKHVFKSQTHHCGGSEALLSDVRMNNQLIVLPQVLLLSPATSLMLKKTLKRSSEILWKCADKYFTWSSADPGTAFRY